MGRERPEARTLIRCSACGQESRLARKPKYDGFTRVGETLSCALCGHVFASEAEVEFREASRPAVFGEEDRPRKLELFEEGETSRMCRHCKDYVVNPFMQRCMRHGKMVEATDTCGAFSAREARAEQ